MTENEERSLNELTEAAQSLTTALTTLNQEAAEKIARLAEYGVKTRKFVMLLAMSFAADILLTILLGVGFVQLGETADRVDRNSNAIQQSREVVRKEALCPLYQQFVNSDTPAARERARQSGQDLAARDEAFKVIHHAYDVLGCSELKGESE